MEHKEYKKVPFSEFLGEYLQEECGIQNLRLPFKCLNDEHSDEHPSMKYNPKMGICHCFACGKTYNILQLVMNQKHLSKKEALEYLESKYKNRAKPEDLEEVAQTKNYGGYDKITKELEKNQIEVRKKSDEELKDYDKDTANYLKSRGFKNLSYIVKLSAIKKIDNRIYIPHFHFIKENEKLTYNCTDYISRTLNPDDKVRYMRQKGVSTSLYNNIDIFNEVSFNNIDFKKYDTYVFITEGEFDALTIEDLYKTRLLKAKEEYETLLKNEPTVSNQFKDFNEFFNYKYNISIFSVGLSSTGNVDKLIEQIKKMPNEKKRELIFVPLCDKDNAGNDANEKLINFFKEEKLYCFNKLAFIDNGYKDINEFYSKKPSACEKKFNDFFDNSKGWADYLRGLKMMSMYKTCVGDCNGKKSIRFIQGCVYEVNKDDETLSKYVFKYNCSETRRLNYFSKDEKTYKNMLKIEGEIRDNYFERFNPKNDVRVVLSSGRYMFNSSQTYNVASCVGKLSRNKIYNNVVEWQKTDAWQYDTNLRGLMLIDKYSPEKDLISSKLYKGGREINPESLVVQTENTTDSRTEKEKILDERERINAERRAKYKEGNFSSSQND